VGGASGGGSLDATQQDASLATGNTAVGGYLTGHRAGPVPSALRETECEATREGLVPAA
jgi:hypothetical protein